MHQSETPAEPLIHAYLRKRLAEGFGGNISRMSEACATTPSMASKWVSEEPRRRVTPSPPSCRKIARGLHVDEDYVLSLAGHRADSTQPAEMNPQLSAFLTAIETGWLAMDEAARELAERGTRALFAVTHHSNNHRVTNSDSEFGRDNSHGHLPARNMTKRDTRRAESRSVANMAARFGFQPAV